MMVPKEVFQVSQGNDELTDADQEATFSVKTLTSELLTGSSK